MSIADSMPTNIFKAAENGDLERVKYLVEVEARSPNYRDAFWYTPVHAAAANARIPVLEYLVSRGGNVNIPDTGGDTPLFFVESLRAAQWLLEHGANINHVNAQGDSPMTHLEPDFPEIAAYLRRVLSNDFGFANSRSNNAVPYTTRYGHSNSTYAQQQINEGSNGWGNARYELEESYSSNANGT